VELDPQETVIAEAGSLMFTDRAIEMYTILGDRSKEYEGVMSKIFSVGKRMLMGKSLFMKAYINIDEGKKQVSYAAPYLGKIVNIKEVHNEQKK